ncbi:hypothetical protein COCC4DRAFT_180636 [Bipolaris maydis ATCC 48331]|uniref:Uncharacterized protein n=2 Tax=Cochliobolus heterostrophus TaxID=5016 RepID=M2TAG4_COCH5|nr:uncharacterized protein COCC4DRAFT_180636 [Bipolaris maydis ATCC 48331]EMD94555.1 hypothetical protein COCHEDRAFT_1128121 [Bipolaris maydis C5]KAJ5028994.1 hypothetical protein J3E73DRAFT_281603 [Bipolaris maydis]ENH99640.1 hypothetical protein COCC4DRAFT_180636 [Bipolaris maydis ATCC 48331]KAJ5062281.1 NAD-binding Rossmann fold oxidoreductase family protein [Bipolaris maydis]KAJ6192388.1 NAD-binding Rossmann fold oxidoreductase family protein [Bipolaris maydis]
MTDSHKRVGLIGLSAKGTWASQSHLPYFQKTSKYKITALQNSSRSAAEAAAKKYSLGGVSTHDSPTSIAQDPNVDIVAVSVNVPQHYDLIQPALEAGKDVFCEWPLARNAAQAEELVNLAKKKGVKTLVGLQARQSPSIIKAKEIVSSGKLGKILGTTMFGHGLVFGGKVITSQLYSLPIEAGANLLTIPFGHAVDALCYVLGSELQGILATLSNNFPEVVHVDEDGKPIEKLKKTAYDFVSITASLINGGGNVAVTYAPEQSRSGHNFYWQIVGSEGTLVLEGGMSGHVQMFQPSVKLAVGEGELKEVEVEKADDFSFSVGKAWDAWAGIGTENGYSTTTWEEALVRHKMIEAIYRSADKGTRENYV